MTFLVKLYLFFAFVLPGILAGEAAPIPDCGSFTTVCCDGEDTEKVPSIGAVVHGCTAYGGIQKCDHPESWWCCSSFHPPPGSDTGVAHGCNEAWPHHVLCPSLPNRKVKRRPGNLSKRNKCDERNMNEFIQKLPTPGIFPVPGLSPVAPQFVPINYEQPSLPNDPGLLTTTTTTTTTTATAPIPDDALLSELSAGSIVGIEGQPSSGSFHLPSSDESVLSQLPPLDFSDGGVDTPFDLSNALSAS